MGQVDRVRRNGVERVSISGNLIKLVIYYISTESIDWMAAVLGLEKPPNNEQAI